MSPIVSVILDLVLMALLGATLVYAVLLNRQMIRLRDGKSELNELIRGLNDAMLRADSGVKSLRKAASDVGEDLRATVAKAQTLRDELNLIVETGESLADRLGSSSERSRPPVASRPLSAPPSARPALIDETIAAARAEAQRQAPPPSEDPLPPREEREGGLSRAERELMRAIENRR